MLNESTINKLREMKLNVMAQAFRDQTKEHTFTGMAFEERFGLLVDAEWAERKNTRLARLIKSANYAYKDACIEDIEYHQDRKLDKTMIARLSSCNFIQECHNIIILGATGSGKTYLSNAFGIAANRNQYTVKYIRLPDLLGELAIARSSGLFPKTIKAYKQINLLILDEWMLHPLTRPEARDLLEIAESRYKKASTIFCSQCEIEGWHGKIGEATLSEAILDRIVHDSYEIFIDGKDSMRKYKGLKK